MADKQQRGSRRVTVALRIKLRYVDLDAFISKYATNISRGGMFISSRNPKDPGTEIRFEIRLADDSPVISGRGVVRWVRAFDPAHPKAPHGMGVEFTSLAEGSEALLDQIVEERQRQGLGDDAAIPHANGHARRAPVVALPPPPPAADTEGPDELRAISDETVARALGRAHELASVSDERQLDALLERPALPPLGADEAPARLAELLGSAPIPPRPRRAPPAARNGVHRAGEDEETQVGAAPEHEGDD